MRRMAASVLFPSRPEIYQLPHSKLKEDFEIAVNVNVNICDNVSEGFYAEGYSGFLYRWNGRSEAIFTQN